MSESVIWANRALVSAAAIYFYDYLLTLPSEIELYRDSGRDARLPASFAALRYFPALYVDSLTAILTTRFMLELAEKRRGRGRDRRPSRSGPRIYDPTSNSFAIDKEVASVLPTTSRTLVDKNTADPRLGSESPKKGEAEDGVSSLQTSSTRSLGWNRLGSCLGARAL
ncbi:hypothetical protein FB45DRAFT_921113 [Roridomyces roridus]|uniref:DUF6533 domain-containing protein n=1 Tax=Roridomyces roridus TaxID=1738132 RepID=A0AAD7BQR5_9AGAR|nr:hypothetical protein FB45DRAFT_921113 [Roridomyces roridus]